MTIDDTQDAVGYTCIWSMIRYLTHSLSSEHVDASSFSLADSPPQDVCINARDPCATVSARQYTLSEHYSIYCVYNWLAMKFK